MTDNVKLDLISTLICHYYEFLYSDDDVKNNAALVAVVDMIDTIIGYEPPGETDHVQSCSYGGECKNCME